MGHILQFIHQTTPADIPSQVQHQAKLCLLDLIGSLCGGRQTRLSKIIRDHTQVAFGGDQATILLDGRRASAPGAALANGMTIDALDIHDSHRESLGHAGVHVFPALLSAVEALATDGNRLINGQEFIASLVVGYDLACRAGVALHTTVGDYHTSGAWGAVSSAALYSRLHGFSAQQTRHALGIAEYHGPRSQMMRCIEHPTMLKDGSGWGAMVGISAAMLASNGFTGAPALTIEADDVAHIWEDLSDRWLIMEQGFKVHGVCWWAQPAIEAALTLLRNYNLHVADIALIQIETFEKATHLDHPQPTTSEEAQYSLPYPVAAALYGWERGFGTWEGLGPHQLLEPNLHDGEVLDLAKRIELIEAPELTALFPDKMLARARVKTISGRILESQNTTFRGEEESPLSETDLRTKYCWLASQVLESKRVSAIEEMVFNLSSLDDIQPLLQALSSPPDRRI